MIGQSQSGTGKTAAFVLTMLSRVDFNLHKPQAICLAPSRELARQIMNVVITMGKYTAVQTEYAIKDHLPKDASNITAQIIVGNPGTMFDLMRRRVLDVNHIKVFVLDEADNMLDQDGLGDQTLRVKKCVFFVFLSFSSLCRRAYFSANSLETNQSRSSSSPPPSQTTSGTLPTSLHQTRTRLSCRRRNYPSIVYDSSTWIARMKSTNMTSWSCSTRC